MKSAITASYDDFCENFFSRNQDYELKGKNLCHQGVKPSSVPTNFYLIVVLSNDNAVLQADGTYLDVDGDLSSITATVVCCGETTSQGCGTNPLSYDYNADQAAWDAVLSADEAACNALDGATGKPHAWEILHAR